MRGRRLRKDSRATEFYQRLVAWKQMSQSCRPSLRALARELGSSHQLLSHYLQRSDKWQAEESRRRAKEIRARAEAENRSLTPWEAEQAKVHDRHAFRFLLDSVLADALRKWELEIKQDIRAGRLPSPQMGKLLLKCASKGIPQARDILERYFQPSARDHSE